MPTRSRLICFALLLSACSPTAQHARPTPPESRTTAPAPPTYGGEDVSWPRLSHREPAPARLGAAFTTGRALLRQGGAIPADYTLPRVGGSDSEPVVLTPCNRTVQLSGGDFELVPPRSRNETLVVIDPGHGGHESGAVAKDGTKEAMRNLQMAYLVRDELKDHVGRLVLTRTADRDTSLAYRIALADRLGASLAVSLHLNDGADGPSRHPGTSTFGALSDPNGRRVAGVLFQAERRYLDTLSPQLGGTWVSNKDAGALYRIGSRGDYYFHLRQSHVTWVISEALYMTNPPETKLIARADVRAGLAHAIAGGILEYLNTSDAGSGWRKPRPRPSFGGPSSPCVDPTA